MKEICFFAIHEDLVAFLELVDRKGSLRYTRTGNFLRTEVNDTPPLSPAAWKSRI